MKNITNSITNWTKNMKKNFVYLGKDKEKGIQVIFNYSLIKQAQMLEEQVHYGEVEYYDLTENEKNILMGYVVFGKIYDGKVFPNMRKLLREIKGNEIIFNRNYITFPHFRTLVSQNIIEIK